MNERLKKQLDFLVEVDKMKNILRQTLIIDKSRRENDAEHSWHFALMAMTLFEYSSSKEVDINRVIKMALVHDLVEVYAGDTFAYDVVGYEDKQKRENEAADKLFSILPKDQELEFRSLWCEFDEMKTHDAMYANAIDRFHPFINNYKTEGYTWKLHKVTIDKIYKRMEIIKYTIPEIWEFVEFAINDSIEKGFIIKGE